MGPEREGRFFVTPGWQLVDSNEQSFLNQATDAATIGAFKPAEGNELLLNFPIELEPGRHYALAFEFADPEDAKGSPPVQRQSFFREYALPEFGGIEYFGAGKQHSRNITLSTSLNSTETVLPVHPLP